ncbi:MAG: hypothetical protein ABSF14_20995 [Terriglobia bacterium]
MLLKFSKAGRIWRVTPEKYSLVQILFAILLFGATAGWLGAVENPKHTGTKLEGYATGVTPESITVFDKQGQERKILTDKDYTSIVGLGAEVTVWYKNEGGVYRLEDIQYPNEGFFLPADRIRENIKRIIILPRSEDVENTQGLFAAISRYLQDNAGWFVAPPELGEEIANRAENTPSSLDAIDPKTGQIDMQQFLEAQGSLVTRIAQETRVDAVLAIKVVKVKANVRGSVASWDGMTEAVASNKTRALSKLTIERGSGWVYAATVDMNLWGRSGKLLWKKRRGFAALGFQRGLGSKYRARPLTEVYEDPEVMETWLATTLGELAPRATLTAPGQVSPELRKQIENAKSTAEEK